MKNNVSMDALDGETVIVFAMKKSVNVWKLSIIRDVSANVTQRGVHFYKSGITTKVLVAAMMTIAHLETGNPRKNAFVEIAKKNVL